MLQPISHSLSASEEHGINIGAIEDLWALKYVGIARSLRYVLEPCVRQRLLCGQPLPRICLRHPNNKIPEVRLKHRPDTHRASGVVLVEFLGDKGEVVTSRIVTAKVVDKSVNATPVREVIELALYHDIFKYGLFGEFALIDCKYH